MENIKGKVFRKTATIQVIDVQDDGVLVYDGSNLDDQWVIPHDVFKNTYDEVK